MCPFNKHTNPLSSCFFHPLRPESDVAKNLPKHRWHHQHSAQLKCLEFKKWEETNHQNFGSAEEIIHNIFSLDFVYKSYFGAQMTCCEGFVNPGLDISEIGETSPGNCTHEEGEDKIVWGDDRGLWGL